MSVKTLTELEDVLAQSLAWRRAELTALEAEIQRNEKTSPNSPLTRALARSGVALLYAHWEGYIKESCEAYLDYVAVRRLKYEELNDGFLITALMALLRRIESGDGAAEEAILDAVRRPAIARARVPRKNTINSRSNLRYDVLVEICRKVGISCESFITRQQLINRSLCDARNEIAHGKLHYPDVGSFEGLQERVIEMMEKMKWLITHHARNSLYKHPQLDVT